MAYWCWLWRPCCDFCEDTVIGMYVVAGGRRVGFSVGCASHGVGTGIRDQGIRIAGREGERRSHAASLRRERQSARSCQLSRVPRARGIRNRSIGI